MSLVVSAPYPLLDWIAEGHAVVAFRAPYPGTNALTDHQLVEAAEKHAEEWQDFAGVLRHLVSAGWSVHGQGLFFASQATSADELVALAGRDLVTGTAVEWCVTDAEGHLVSVGGLVAGHPLLAETFPAGTLPALVENELTGAQRLVNDERELRAAMQQEVAACAQWWRARPQDQSDHNAHALPDGLDKIAVALVDRPAPRYVMHEPDPARILSRSPVTRVQAHPVGAIVFAGVLDAIGSFSLSSLSPRTGLGQTLHARGQGLANDLGLLASPE